MTVVLASLARWAGLFWTNTINRLNSGADWPRFSGFVHPCCKRHCADWSWQWMFRARCWGQRAPAGFTDRKKDCGPKILTAPNNVSADSLRWSNGTCIWMPRPNQGREQPADSVLVCVVFATRDLNPALAFLRATPVCRNEFKGLSWSSPAKARLTRQELWAKASAKLPGYAAKPRCVASALRAPSAMLTGSATDAISPVCSACRPA